MKKIKFKLQNLIFTEKYGLDEHWWMQYRTRNGRRMIHDNKKSCHILSANDTIDCFTYLNSITIRKWRKYTQIDDVTLNLKVKGTFDIQLFGHYRESGDIKKEWIGEKQRFYCPEITEISISYPKNLNSEVAAFYLATLSDVEIYEGYYSTFVDRDAIRNVEISIASTTFRKEEYIENNIHVLERELFYSDEQAGQHITLRIVDNGRTLDQEKYESEYIHIYPNQNVGGAGGFTRGILESMSAEKKPTHIILMDDDVKILPESLIRTYTLLSLIKPEYDTHFISGAMLFMEHMNIQHEDVGYVHKDGSFGPRKPGMQLHLWDHVFMNEEEYEPMPDSYAGWWYCCIPVKTMDMSDLPIPLFIRGDDVEYSVKQHAQFITLNGICIWHKEFANKYNAALELYLVHRNSFITQAMSGICEDIDFMERIDAFFWKELKRLSYQSCELLLDAVEDYLNGPEFMMTPQGERIMKEQGAKNEKMHDIRDFRELNLDMGHVFDGIYDEAELRGFKKFWYNLTCNGHIGPNWLLKKEIGVIPYDWFEAPAKQYMKKELLAVNPVEKTAYLRVRSRKRYLELIKRRKKLMKRYKTQGKQIAEQYRKASETLKGEKFWKEYLGM